MVDLSDVYMTFFLPTKEAAKMALGSDIHIILDAAPNIVIPAKTTFVGYVFFSLALIRFHKTIATMA